MQEAHASCSGVRDPDPDPDPPDFHTSHPLNSPLPLSRRPTIALELFNRFEQANSDNISDDVIMADVASDPPSIVSIVSSVPERSSSHPRDDNSERSDKKRSGEPLPANISSSKKVIVNINQSDSSALPSGPAAKPSLPNQPSADYATAFRYCGKDKPPYIVQIQSVQDSDSTSLHPLHISRIVSQASPRNILEIRKIGRNRIVAEMCTYDAANRLLENKSLSNHNLKALVPLHRILRTGVVRDVPQDYTLDMIKESIASPIKVLDIHRLNRRVRIENETKYLPSRTVCIKFSGQFLPQYVYLHNCRYAVSPYVPKARICFSCFRIGHVSKSCKSRPRCLFCGDGKHDSPDPCSRSQGPQVCINCSGAHLATSNLCPHLVRHKMTLSLASTRNIPYSEARKSVNLPGFNSSSFQSPIPDPRYDYINFPNTLSSNSNSNSPPFSFESPNRFSYLSNLSSNTTTSGSPPSSFSSAAKSRPNLINRNLTDVSNSKNSSQPRSSYTRVSHSHNAQPISTSSSSSPPNFQAHYNLLNTPNGRFPPQSGNGVAFASHPPFMDPPPYHALPFQQGPTTPAQSSLLNDIYIMMRHISSFLPSLLELSPTNGIFSSPSDQNGSHNLPSPPPSPLVATLSSPPSIFSLSNV